MSDLIRAAIGTALSVLLVALVIWIGRGAITGHWVPYALE